MVAALTSIPARHVTALLAGTRAGTPGAEDELWRLVGPVFQRLASWLLAGDAQRFRITTDDLMQLAFLKVRRGYLKNAGLRRGDLRRMVMLAMKQVLVDESRRARIEARDLAERLRGDQEDPVAHWQLADLRDRLQRLLRCNPLQSRILELHIFEGMSHRRIAGVVKISASQVGNEIEAAQRRLAAMG